LAARTRSAAAWARARSRLQLVPGTTDEDIDALRRIGILVHRSLGEGAVFWHDTMQSYLAVEALADLWKLGPGQEPRHVPTSPGLVSRQRESGRARGGHRDVPVLSVGRARSGGGQTVDGEHDRQVAGETRCPLRAQ
jgi:hypothetical protein